MSPLRLLRAWWKRLIKSAMNCLRMSSHPVMTVDPFPLTTAFLFKSGVDVNPTKLFIINAYVKYRESTLMGGWSINSVLNLPAQWGSYFLCIMVLEMVIGHY